MNKNTQNIVAKFNGKHHVIYKEILRNISHYKAQNILHKYIDKYHVKYCEIPSKIISGNEIM